MDVTYKTDRIQVHEVVSDVKELVKFISDVDTVLGETKCGACESEKVHLEHRTAKGYDFYSVKCEGCGCRLDFGSLKDGAGLFPRRKDESGNWLENRGWVKKMAEGAF